MTYVIAYLATSAIFTAAWVRIATVLKRGM